MLSSPQGFNVGMNLGAPEGAGIRRPYTYAHHAALGGDTNFRPCGGRNQSPPEDLPTHLQQAAREVLALRATLSMNRFCQLFVRFAVNCFVLQLRAGLSERQYAFS